MRYFRVQSLHCHTRADAFMFAPASPHPADRCICTKERPLKRSELLRVEGYLRKKFGNNSISLKEQKDGSCEVSLGDEFIGVVYRDDEDEEVSYDFHMAILDIDLDDGTDIPIPD